MFSGSASKLYNAAGNEWVTSPQHSFCLDSVVDRLYILSSHNIIFVTDDLSLIIYQLQALDMIPIEIHHFLSSFMHKNVPMVSVCGRVLVTKNTTVRQAQQKRVCAKRDRVLPHCPQHVQDKWKARLALKGRGRNKHAQTEEFHETCV